MFLCLMLLSWSGKLFERFVWEGLWCYFCVVLFCSVVGLMLVVWCCDVLCCWFWCEFRWWCCGFWLFLLWRVGLLWGNFLFFKEFWCVCCDCLVELWGFLLRFECLMEDCCVVICWCKGWVKGGLVWEYWVGEVLVWVVLWI